ncbi:MAG: hypothetical protein Ta2B_18470 [Termitinemataceae bacterium]|nr:MAG: hypothetical protein Ta2B_18470 [Termitinemataceae bacterium]
MDACVDNKKIFEIPEIDYLFFKLSPKNKKILLKQAEMLVSGTEIQDSPHESDELL